MNNIDIRDDITLTCEEISDGEAICLTEKFKGKTTEKIILIRPVAIAVAKRILEIVGEK